jgi:hypothetical protein
MWFALDKEDHHVLRSFIKQLELDNLGASPSGLYKITSSILLNVATLIITYVIVLLQSN